MYNFVFFRDCNFYGFLIFSPVCIAKSGFYGCAEFSLGVSCKLFAGNIFADWRTAAARFFRPDHFFVFFASLPLYFAFCSLKGQCFSRTIQTVLTTHLPGLCPKSPGQTDRNEKFQLKFRTFLYLSVKFFNAASATAVIFFILYLQGCCSYAILTAIGRVAL